MGALRDFEYSGWQDAASSYEAFTGASRLFVPALVKAAGAAPGKRLLDVACGPGVATAAAAAAGAQVTGLDFSPAMLAIARSLHPHLMFESGDAENLPFADGSFEAVIANFGMHHMETPARAMAEARRALVEGGTFAFTFWADPRENTAWRLIVDAVAARGHPNVPMPAGNDAHATPENFSRLMLGAGFGERTLRCELLTHDWLLPPDADVVSIFATGTVRMGALLRGQGDALPAVRRHVRDAAQSYLRDGAIVLPTRAWLISAKQGEG